MGIKNILVDTNAYASFKRGKIEAIEIIQRASIIGINSIILGELFAGFTGGNRFEKNAQELQNFLGSSRVTMLPIDQQTAEIYAEIFCSLKQKGKPIPTNDIWISASALQHNLAIFTYDKHFQHVKNLVVGNNLNDFEI